MKTKDIKPETYCVGCRHYLQFQCEILGLVSQEKRLICNAAGYRDIKQTYSTVRHYQNRQGDRYESEKR